MSQNEEKKNDYIKFAIKTISLSMSLLFLYCAYFGSPPSMVYLTNFFSIVLLTSFLLRPLGGELWYRKFNWFFIINIFFILCPIIMQIYIAKNIDIWYVRYANPSILDVIVATVYLALTIEATRRILGLPLALVALFFILITAFSNHLFGVLYGPALKWRSIIGILVMQTVGIFGIPVSICASYISLFLLFGELMEEIKIQKVVADIAYSLTGRQVGGAAKATIISTALTGMITGSSSANVAATGTFTFSLMKKLGYEPTWSAGLLAAAGNGGQIMPPVMGAAAFVIAQFLGISYWAVCVAAAIPAILYYFSLFTIVHLESYRRDLLPIPKKDLPNIRKSLKDSGLPLLSVVVLIYFLARGYSLEISIFLSFFIALILSFVCKSTRIKPSSIIKVFERGFKNLVLITLACACAGIVIGCISISGLGLRFSSIMLDVGKGNLFFSLIIASIICLVLGMGILTTGVYITAAALVVPALIKLGLTPLSANLFVFYFAVISCVTPPVATAAYMAAGIAGTDMFRTGISAFKIGAAAYLIPFYFVYQTELLLEKGSFLQIILVVATVSVAVLCFSIGLVGYFFHKKLSVIERFLITIPTLLAINLNTIRVVLIFVIFSLFFFYNRKELPKKNLEL